MRPARTRRSGSTKGRRRRNGQALESSGWVMCARGENVTRIAFAWMAAGQPGGVNACWLTNTTPKTAAVPAGIDTLAGACRRGIRSRPPA